VGAPPSSTSGRNRQEAARRRKATALLFRRRFEPLRPDSERIAQNKLLYVPAAARARSYSAIRRRRLARASFLKKTIGHDSNSARANNDDQSRRTHQRKSQSPHRSLTSARNRSEHHGHELRQTACRKKPRLFLGIQIHDHVQITVAKKEGFRQRSGLLTTADGASATSCQNHAHQMPASSPVEAPERWAPTTSATKSKSASETREMTVQRSVNVNNTVSGPYAPSPETQLNYAPNLREAARR